MGAGEADRGRRGRQGQARPMGAGEAGGARRGWWGQARPMGAVSRRAKSIVNRWEVLRRGKGEDREEGEFVNSNRRDGGGAAETEAGRGRRR
jgi:hypothetical protein